MRFTRRRFVSFAASIVGALRLSSLASFAQAPTPMAGKPVGASGKLSKPTLQLWFEQPAELWQDALPVGNGRLGGMIFGGVKSERIAMNEDTLWSGAPKEWNNPGAKAHLPIVRKLVLEDKNYQAADAECLKMEGPWNEAYEPLGDLLLEFDHEANASSYRRDLDLEGAIASVEYEVGGVRHLRELFSSMPDNVMVLRMTTSKPHALSLHHQAGKPTEIQFYRAGGQSARRRSFCQEKLPANRCPSTSTKKTTLRFSTACRMAKACTLPLSCLRCARRASKRVYRSGALRIEKATSLVLTMGAATGYRGFAIAPDKPLEEVVAAARKPVAAAHAEPFEALLRRHQEDYQSLFQQSQS